MDPEEIRIQHILLHNQYINHVKNMEKEMKTIQKNLKIRDLLKRYSKFEGFTDDGASLIPVKSYFIGVDNIEDMDPEISFSLGSNSYEDRDCSFWRQDSDNMRQVILDQIIKDLEELVKEEEEEKEGEEKEEEENKIVLTVTISRI